MLQYLTLAILFYLFIIEIHDTLYERMGLKKHKNNYGDLFDEEDDLVMYGSQVIWSMSSTIHPVTTRTLVPPCHGYCITKKY